jgi:hypothetical protein
MIDPRFTKAVNNSIVVQAEENTLKAIFDSDVTYTLCDRSSVTDKKGHYFVSFNLPSTQSDLNTGSTLSLIYPELQQLNVDQIIICPIPSSKYSEMIDGRSITWKVPQLGGSSQTTMSSITLYSSTYSSNKPLKGESNPLLGDNIVFLFSDSINKPYSGYTTDEMGIRTNHQSNTTWEPDSTNFLRRPSAVSYKEVEGNDYRYGISNQLTTASYNTDQRTNAKYAVSVPSNYPNNRAGYNYDIPVGFVVLDKGFMVITHSAITQNFPWTSGFTYGSNTALTGSPALSAKTNIYFTGTSSGNKSSYVSYYDINTSFKSTAVCLALPREFYISNNSTWNREKALTDLNSQTGVVSLDPVYVTEVGLFNALGELVAIGKLSEPVEKNYINVLTFNIDIEM